MAKPNANGTAKKKLSRRAFLKGGGLVAAATSAGGLLSGCSPQSGPQPSPTPLRTLDDKYLHVPPAPRLPPDPDVFEFFTPEEARTMDALVGRLLPGTPEDPGAREAGVTIFIDRLLATTNGYAEPTYTRPPYARFYSGEAPPPEAAETDPAEVIWVPEAWKGNFGWQSGAPPQELYRAGLVALDEMAGGSFVDLSEAAQDALLDSISGEGQGGGQNQTAFDQLGLPGFSASVFFDLVKTHTVHGMFGDPLYGGNRYLAGWLLVGYPGARRAYTERDMQTEGTNLEPQSLAELPPFHPGQPVNDSVIIPLANGSLIEQQTDKSASERLLFCRPRQ